MMNGMTMFNHYEASVCDLAPGSTGCRAATWLREVDGYNRQGMVRQALNESRFMRDRVRQMQHDIERHTARLVSLTEIEPDADMTWRSRFMPREV